MSAAAALILCMSPTVHDGDTLRCGSVKIRIDNIEAPELPGSPKCDPRRGHLGWCDYDLGYASRNALVTLIRQGRTAYQPVGTDPYGRTLAIVYVGAIDAGQYLIDQGLARPWR